MTVLDLGITEEQFYALDGLEQTHVLGSLYMQEEGVNEVDIHKFETWKFMKEFEGGFF